ncbi:YchF/TatD family DNA exonuclease [Candidatus Woesearchaeota archaeon]|nr:YchF/TatD family DNA exonuclease [Candidatus Woesearchaeota archaeon]
MFRIIYWHAGNIMGLIDLHCHLDFRQFRDDLDEVIARAKKAGVELILQNGVNPESNRKSLEIAERYKDVVRPALGIHPTDAVRMSDEAIDAELDFIEKNKEMIAALGEVGIDHHWIKEADQRKKQAECFQKIIDLAERIRKPIIVHSWDADQETVEMLQSSNAKKVVMHCFTGKPEIAKQAEDEGHYFTISTNIVKSKQFRKLAKRIPMERLFTETDAPFMSPFQGKRNEPAFVAEAVRKIAEIRKIGEKEVADQISNNYDLLFRG